MLLEFELAYYDVTEQHVNHYAMGTPSHYTLGTPLCIMEVHVAYHLLQIDLMIWVQILDENVSISLCSNTLGKRHESFSSSSTPAIDKPAWRLGKETRLREEKTGFKTWWVLFPAHWSPILLLSVHLKSATGSTQTFIAINKWPVHFLF